MSELSFDLHFADYGRSVALAGGLPVELTRDADVDEIVAHLDGLVLSGGADVEPAHYQGDSRSCNLSRVSARERRTRWNAQSAC